MIIKISDELFERLKQAAKRVTWDSDPYFIPYDYCGGNYDDAYYGGKDDGETELAKAILACEVVHG